MRLLTGHSQEEYERCRRDLTQMVQESSAKIFASNQVIGEAYIALHHHYGISKPEARQALTSGLIGSLKGQAVLAALSEQRGTGLLPPGFCNICGAERSGSAYLWAMGLTSTSKRNRANAASQWSLRSAAAWGEN